MGKPAEPRAVASQRTSSLDDTALESSLARVERFVDTLDVRYERARGRAGHAAKGARSAVRAQRELEERFAELQAAQHLRHAIAAAVASAQAQVAVIEAETRAAVGAAFQQFKKDRVWRRRATKPSGVRGRLQRAASTPMSPDALARMIASAKQAIVYVILDRNRLTERLVDTRAEAAKLRALLAAAVVGSPGEAASIGERVDLCEAYGAYLEQQLLASATAVQRLLFRLRKLLHELPEPVARAVERLKSSELLSRNSN